MVKLFKENWGKYKWIFIAGLSIQMVASIMTIGYHNPDEQGQINEFAAYKLGLADARVMPWEHHRQARQTIQPFIVFSLSKVMIYGGCFNPFHVSTILRIFSGLLAWLSTMLIVMQAKSFFKSTTVFKWSLMCASFLWFIPYVHARFQGENWAGIFLAFGIFHVLQNISRKVNPLHFTVSGVLLGTAFDCRYQVGFAIVCLGLWLLAFRKITFVQVLFMLTGFAVMIGVEALIDYWYYGNWIFMPYRYFYIQLIEGLSNSFGVFPWWYYFKLFLMQAAVPLSAVLLSMLFISSVLNPKHLFTWIIWGFVLGHNINGYKEIRYLYPLIPYFCVLIFLLFGHKWWEMAFINLKPAIAKTLIGILLVENMALLTVASIKPAKESIGLISKVYDYSDQKIILYCTGKNPYDWDGTTYNFYRPSRLEVLPFDSASFVNEKTVSGTKILVFNNGFDLEEKYKNMPLNNIYKTIPDWLKYFNIGNWLSRANSWGLYEKTH